MKSDRIPSHIRTAIIVVARTRNLPTAPVDKTIKKIRRKDLFYILSHHETTHTLLSPSGFVITSQTT